MAETISSRTPEGEPNVCPVCGAVVTIEPSTASGDAPCPGCGTLLWFVSSEHGLRLFDAELVERIRRRLVEMNKQLGVSDPERTSELAGLIGADSLDAVELIMQLEEDDDLDSEMLRRNPDMVAEIIEWLLRQRRDEK